MPPRSSQGRRETRRNTWDANQRRALHIIHKHFNLEPTQRVEVFNRLFKDHLHSCDLPFGLQSKALEAQYQERKSLKKQHVWAVICQDPSTDHDWQQHHALTRRIRDIAAELQSTRNSTVPVIAPERQSSVRPTTAKAHASQSTRISAAQPQVIEDDEDTVHAAPAAPSPPPTSRAVRREPSVEPSVVRRIEGVVVLPTNSSSPRSSKRYSAARELLSTPVKRSNKRLRTSLEDALDSDYIDAPLSPTVKRSAKRSAGSLKTNSTSKVVFHRRHGPSVNISPAKYERTQQALVPVEATQAHGPPGRLLFRYWSPSTSFFGDRTNSDNGFRATRYAFTNGPLPDAPAANQVHWADVENHINRNPVTSPFVSTADSLVWILSKIALPDYFREGKRDARISIIDSAAISPKSIFHPKYYHLQLRRHYVFTEAAWCYAGRSEYMIWAEIPKRAFIRTIKISDLVHFTQRDQSLADALRFSVLAQRKGLHNTIIPELQAQSVELTPRFVTAFGKLCSFIGIQEPAHVQSIIGSLVLGWALRVELQSPEDWAKEATLFAKALTNSAGLSLRFDQLHQLKVSYLYGVREGHKGVFNMLHPAERTRNIARMEREASLVGLESPASIVLRDMQAAIDAVRLYEQQQQARFAVAAPGLPGS